MDNLKVIMLDDEVLIRKLIKMKMNAKDLNLEIVGEFSNASSALLSLNELKPDIIISDICMPEVDGISFSEQCTEILPNSKVIIVTGYNDFEYARRSLKAGVYVYLMKPIQADELNNSLRKAIKQIRKEQEEKEIQKKFFEEREKDIPLLRNSCLNLMFMVDKYDMDIEQKLESYGVNIKLENGIQIGILAIQESITHPEILSELKAETELFFQSEKNLYVLLDSWGRIVIICAGDIFSFKDCFELLIKFIENKYDYYLQVGCSRKFDEFKEIRTAYIDALDNMFHRYGKQKTRQTDKSEWSKVIECINNGKTQDALSALDSILINMKIESERIVITKDLVTNVFQKICNETKHSLNTFDGFKKLEVCCCEDDIIRCMHNVIMNLSVQKAILKEGEKGRLMKRIIYFMEENLNNSEINMNVLISEFAISSSLLSRLFKTFTGKTYSDFLSELRLWKMIELLSENSEMRDRDIGERIGIKDPHYLSIWFRKTTGFSVTEYRRMKRI